MAKPLVLGMTPPRSGCRSKLTSKTIERDEGVRPPSCHLAQHSDNQASTLIRLLESCGRPDTAVAEGSWPDAMQRSPRRVRSSAKDVINNTARAAFDLGRRAARQGMQSIKRDGNR